MNKIHYYQVGGSVRDIFLGLKSKDIDFSVEAVSYDAMKQDLIRLGISIYLETPEFYTIRGSHPKYGGVDYVLCRKDGRYTDGRHPETVEVGDIYDDLARRDFTINAMAILPELYMKYDPEDQNSGIIDPYNGRKDIKERIIRCVGDPRDRFEEDALRILRAIRFAVKFNFEIEPLTSEAMKIYRQKLTLLPIDRIREELEKCFKANVIRTLKLIEAYKITKILFEDTNLWLLPTTKEK